MRSWPERDIDGGARGVRQERGKPLDLRLQGVHLSSCDGHFLGGAVECVGHCTTSVVAPGVQVQLGQGA